MTEDQKYLATRYKELQDKLAYMQAHEPQEQEEVEAWQTWVGAAINELAEMGDEYEAEFQLRPPPPPPPPPWWS